MLRPLRQRLRTSALSSPGNSTRLPCRTCPRPLLLIPRVTDRTWSRVRPTHGPKRRRDLVFSSMPPASRIPERSEPRPTATCSLPRAAAEPSRCFVESRPMGRLSNQISSSADSTSPMGLLFILPGTTPNGSISETWIPSSDIPTAPEVSRPVGPLNILPTCLMPKATGPVTFNSLPMAKKCSSRSDRPLMLMTLIPRPRRRIVPTSSSSLPTGRGCECTRPASAIPAGGSLSIPRPANSGAR